MSGKSEKAAEIRFNVPTLEADMAFFQARLSLAGESPETLYEVAQIKTYHTLGKLMGKTLQTLKPKKSQKDSGQK